MTKSKAATAAAEPAEAAAEPKIAYDEAVREAREIVARRKQDAWRLGQFADRVESGYGKATLAKFAKAVGIPHDTMRSFRATYRAWSDPDQKVPRGTNSEPLVPHAVRKALAAHPDRAAIVRGEPRITSRRASALARVHRQGAGKTSPREVTLLAVASAPSPESDVAIGRHIDALASLLRDRGPCDKKQALRHLARLLGFDVVVSDPPKLLN
jgi:hypothetical protein